MSGYDRLKDREPGSRTARTYAAPSSNPVQLGLLALGVALLIVLVGLAAAVLHSAQNSEGLLSTTKQCGSLTIRTEDECVDIVIVGSGAAGSTVAGTVSANGTYNTVVLEAGDDNYADDTISNPNGGLTTTFGYVNPQYFWPGESVYQGQLGQPQNVVYRFTNGRLLGGGSAVNTMLVVRGSTYYWDNMDTLSGGHGVWTGANVYALMKSQENFTAHEHWVAGETRGTTGGWSITARPINDISSDAINLIDAIVNISNVPLVDDYNDPDIGDFASYRLQMQQRHEVTPYLRESSATAFLPASVMDQVTHRFVAPRRGRVQLRATVQRLLWDTSNKTKCVGVSYIDADSGSETKRIYATKAVVLSTGIHDSQMLQLEGIGPAATLTSAKVPTRVISEHVGRHYQTHIAPLYTFLWNAMTGEDTDTEPGNIGHGGHAFVPDPSAIGTPGFRNFHIIPFPFPGGFLFIAFYTAPPYEGTIDIQNGDPNKPPLVDPKYFTNPLEIASHRAIIKQYVAGFAAYNENITLVSPIDMDSDASIDAFIKSDLFYTHHYSSHTRMGTSIDNAVVDWRTRVYGTSNLRVCSASIFPWTPDANTCTPTVAVGGMCGKMLVEDLL